MTFESLAKKADKQGLDVRESEDKTLIEALNKYTALKAQIAELEEQMKPFKAKLEIAAQRSSDGIIVINDHKVHLVPVSRENFGLKKAKETLDQKAFEKFLAPFITVSNYTQLKVSHLE